MRILGIETSCDETAAAVVKNGTKILSNVVASSVELHKKTGGIIPEVAAREQVKCIVPVIEEALKIGCGWEVGSESRNEGEKWGKKKTKHPPSLLTSRRTSHISLPIPNIDAIAVTIGPGLIGSLLVGVETAKTLAYVWKKPIVPVNHLQAHLYANWLSSPSQPTPDSQLTSHPHPQFPAIGLVVSGGHTELVLMKNHGKYKWLGGTRDDAAGECFDKTARLLGLGYPGGPAIEKAAKKGSPKAFDLPRPMIKQENFDFSFAGLKTAALREVRKLEVRSKSGSAGGKWGKKKTKHPPSLLTSRRASHISLPTLIPDLAASIQQAIVDVLVEKTIRAAEKYKVKSVLLAGGVAANQLLREQLSIKVSGCQGVKLHVPPPRLCTDNATYIASCAYFNYQPIDWQKLAVNPGLGIAEAVVDRT